MRLIQLVEFLADYLSVPAYPLEFPTNNTDETVISVDIINGSESGGVIEFIFQVMTRSSHPSIAEEQGNTIIETLHNKTNLTWDGLHIILIQKQNPNPFYSGQDKNDNYIYTTDFRMLVE